MKNIWIFNHYAGPPSVTTGLRHYYFAKELIAAGYSVTVFAASTVHNTDRNLIEDDRPYLEMEEDGVPFVFVRTDSYQGNGKKRIINMLQYYRRLFKVTKHFSKPDVIIGSSVHPLACVAAIKLAKRYHCPAIAEIRDLWPESIVAFTSISPHNPAIWALYRLEKWIYKKADKLIFTMEGGKSYIQEQGWDTGHGGPVDLSKISHINNGVDLSLFDENSQKHTIQDSDLENPNTFKVIYAGSVRKANDVDQLVKCASLVQPDIVFLIYGDGEDREALERYCREQKITNVLFKGKVGKEYIPYILSKSNLNVLNYQQASVWKYGSSQNKMFEYFASGKPVLSNVDINYSIIRKYECGVSENLSTPESYAEKIEQIAALSAEEYDRLCRNARRAAEDFEVKALARKLVKLLS